jgi:hypothetical protein
MAIVVYTAVRMTGRSKASMVKEAEEAVAVLSKYGIKVISPVLAEGIKPEHEILQAISDEQLAVEWKKDKKFVRECHVVLDLSSASKWRSEGACHELAYARYALFRPCVRLFPKGLGPSVTKLEDSVIVQTLDEAGIEILKRWGTRYQRICWRIRERIVWKWLKLLRLQFMGFFR